MKVHIVLVEPQDTNSYIHDVYGDKEQADEEAVDLRGDGVAASVRPFTVDDLDEVEKQVHRQNSDGTVGMTIPHDVTGPNGEEIAPGDVISFLVTSVEKQEGGA